MQLQDVPINETFAVSGSDIYIKRHSGAVKPVMVKVGDEWVLIDRNEMVMRSDLEVDICKIKIELVKG